jgi:hypothetical protein
MVRSGRSRKRPAATCHNAPMGRRVMTDYDNTKKLSGISPWPVHSHTRKGRSYVEAIS